MHVMPTDSTPAIENAQASVAPDGISYEGTGPRLGSSRQIRSESASSGAGIGRKECQRDDERLGPGR